MQRLRELRSSLKRSAFRLAQNHLRLHVTPVHFYSPIPDLRELSPETFTQPSACPGLDFGVDRQLSQLHGVFASYRAEYQPAVNAGLSQIDAFVLYALIRERRPRKLIEIGSGHSTLISLAALAKNASEGHVGHMTAIEPYPRAFLKSHAGNFTLLERKVQEVALDVFASADILFIDSSHVSKVGSDVNYEILEIVPRMKVGSLVHWHDIVIPMNYSRAWVESGHQFWNESYVVHAFMLHNKCFRVTWAGRYMQINHAKELREAFPYFHPEDPEQQLSSFWIERVA